MLDLERMSNSDLAMCVDEYVRRAFAHVRAQENFDNDATRVVIEATQFRKDAEFTVKHSFQLGDNYGSEGFARSETSNAIEGAHSCVHRMYIDRGSAPKKYSTLLPAPDPEVIHLVDEEIVAAPIEPTEDAVFEPVNDDESDKGIPC